MTEFVKKTAVYPEWTQFDCPVNQGINSFDMTHHSGTDKTDQEYAKINCKSNFVSTNCRNIFDDGDELQQTASFNKSIKPNAISKNYSEYSCNTDEALTGLYFSHNKGENNTNQEYLNARCCKDMRMQNCTWTPYKKLVESLPDKNSDNKNSDNKTTNNKTCEKKTFTNIKCKANQSMQGIRFTHKKNENGTSQRYVSVKCCDVDDEPEESYNDTESRVYQLHDMHNGILQSNYDTSVGYNYRRDLYKQKQKNNHDIDDYFYEEMDSKESYKNIDSDGASLPPKDSEVYYNSNKISSIRICLIVLLIIVLLGILFYKHKKLKI